MRYGHHATRIFGVLALGLMLAACESFDLDDLFNKKKPLPGERKPVFSDGVPGAPQGVPPELVRGYQPPTQPQEAVVAEPPKEKPKPVARPPRPRPNTVAVPAKPPSTNITVQPNPNANTGAPPPPSSWAPPPRQPPDQQQPQQQQPAQQQTGAPPPPAWPSQQSGPQVPSPWPNAPPSGTFSR